MTSDKQQNIPTEKQAIHRKSYQSPKLSTFGTVTQLTQTASMGMFDDGGGTVQTSMTFS